MPTLSPDLHGRSQDRAEIALLMVDVINALDFPEADQLLERALPMAEHLSELKAKAVRANIPVIYANDNFGRWRSDFRALVRHCTAADSRGRPIAERLKPEEDDYFVLKPKHSAFFHTTLDLLLRHLGTRTLIVTGVAGDICVLFTANDAYMRDYRLVVPADCTASNTVAKNLQALEEMRKLLKADTRNSSEWTFDELLTKSNRSSP